MRDVLAAVECAFICLIAVLTLYALWCGFKECTGKIRYNHQVKHRFDKPPTAKCYCRDCKYHSGETKRCYRFGETTKEYRCTADNWFCWEATPLSETENNRNTDMGNVSDGYHTFNELYDHRAKLFAALCNEHKDLAWKSKLHSDGTMYDKMFIVGIDTPLGQATYHYDIHPYWDLFNVKELEKAPVWDGHTPDDAIVRIGSLRWVKKKNDDGNPARVAYICDRRFCKDCNNPECHHCFDITHARNFECVAENEYWEKETSDENH